MSNCKVISVINWKGGVGKTTLTHHLATGFAHLTDQERQKYLGTRELPRVLLIDNDAQCSLSVLCLGEKEYEDNFIVKKKGTIADLYVPFLQSENPLIDVQSYIMSKAVNKDAKTSYDRVDLLPAHQELIYTDMDLAVYTPPSYKGNMKFDTNLVKLQVLNRILKESKDNYDYIFIDCPPNLNYVTQNALYFSDYYLIPTQLDFLSVYGISSIIAKVDDLNATFADIQMDYQPTKLIGIVANKVKEYGKEPKISQTGILLRLYETFGETVFENYVTDGEGITNASQIATTVYATSGSGSVAKKQAEAMREILCETLERI